MKCSNCATDQVSSVSSVVMVIYYCLVPMPPSLICGGGGEGGCAWSCWTDALAFCILSTTPRAPCFPALDRRLLVMGQDMLSHMSCILLV